MRFRRFVSFSFSLAAILTAACVLEAQTDRARRPVARLGDETIYELDLLPAIGGQLLQLEKQKYDLKIEALIDLANHRALAQEAKSKGVSVEDLLEQTIGRSGIQWNASEIEGFYLARKDSFKKPLDEVRPQVERALVQAKREEARQRYLDQLRQRAGFTILFDRPKPEIPADPSRLRGNPKAPVTIVEFADFQCPYSQAVQSVVKEIMTKYHGRVRLAFFDFPDNQAHPESRRAAEAGRCAAEQDKFWEYHDLLFAAHARIDPEGLLEQSRDAGLDTTRFSKCLADGRFRHQVDYDVGLGKSFGVTGTPTIFVNGFAITGSQPLSDYEKVIDSELAQPKGNETEP